MRTLPSLLSCATAIQNNDYEKVEAIKSSHKGTLIRTKQMLYRISCVQLEQKWKHCGITIRFKQTMYTQNTPRFLFRFSILYTQSCYAVYLSPQLIYLNYRALNYLTKSLNAWFAFTPRIYRNHYRTFRGINVWLDGPQENHFTVCTLHCFGIDTLVYGQAEKLYCFQVRSFVNDVTISAIHLVESKNHPKDPCFLLSHLCAVCLQLVYLSGISDSETLLHLFGTILHSHSEPDLENNSFNVFHTINSNVSCLLASDSLLVD